VLLHTKVTRTAHVDADRYDFHPYFTEFSKYVNGDLTIVNIEMPIDVFDDNRNLSSYPLFNAPYEILDAVRDMGFNLFINANNHTFDKGWDGFVATRANFDRAGVVHTGTAETEDEERFYLREINGITFGVIAYTDSLNGLDYLVPQDKRGFAVNVFSHSLEGAKRIAGDIARCREAGAEFVVVSLHWGVEYVNNPSETQKQIARMLVENGADIIMGNHSHCVQPIEEHTAEDGRTGLIIYSLGNFFADQNDMQVPIRKTQYAMLVSVTVERAESGKPEIINWHYIPTFVYRYADNSSATGVYYALLSSADFLDNEGFFVSASDFARNREAYEHVVDIVGEDHLYAPS